MMTKLELHQDRQNSEIEKMKIDVGHLNSTVIINEAPISLLDEMHGVEAKIRSDLKAADDILNKEQEYKIPKSHDDQSKLSDSSRLSSSKEHNAIELQNVQSVIDDLQQETYEAQQSLPLVFGKPFISTTVSSLQVTNMEAIPTKEVREVPNERNNEAAIVCVEKGIVAKLHYQLSEVPFQVAKQRVFIKSAWRSDSGKRICEINKRIRNKLHQCRKEKKQSKLFQIRRKSSS